MKFCKYRGSKREQRSRRGAVGTITTKTVVKDTKEDRATPEHCRRTVRAIRDKSEERVSTGNDKRGTVEEKARQKSQVDPPKGSWGEHREEGRISSFLVPEYTKGLKYSKEPHLGPPSMPLCPRSRSSISTEVQVLPCLSYAVGELVLSSISGTNLRPPLQAACLQSCLWHHLLPLDSLGGPSSPHLLWDCGWTTATGI